MARSLRRQFERRWRKHKSELNRSRLRRQIAWCNRLASKDKGSHYTNLITANSGDPKKLWLNKEGVASHLLSCLLIAQTKALWTCLLLFSPIKSAKSGTSFLLLALSMMLLIWCLLLSMPLCLSLKTRSISVSVNPPLNLAHLTLYQHSSLRIVLISSSLLLPSW